MSKYSFDGEHAEEAPPRPRIQQPQEPSQRAEQILFSAICEEAADQLDISRADEPMSQRAKEYLKALSARLRALESLVREIESGTSDETSADDFCNRIAAGFTADV